MIFAREISAPLTSLVKQIDAATVANRKDKMGSFVVFLSDDPALEKKLKALAEQEKIKKTLLTLYEAAGPEDYHVAKEAEVTVVLYVENTVKANYAFRKGELQDKQIAQIVKDLSKILPGP
jgi:hypothetical protein